MLDYNELENIARLKRLSIKNAEKDYLQDLILFIIYSQLGKDFVFKGGTCIYKIYNIGRFSEDLDFTLNNKVDIARLGKSIMSDLLLLGIKSRIKDVSDYRNQTNVRLLIHGPLYKGSKNDECFIPLNISKKEHVLLEPKKEFIHPIYKELQNFQVFAMQEKEILAEKVRAILTRDKARDIYDLWFLVARKNIEVNFKLIDKKLQLYNLKFNQKEFIKKISAMKGFWQTDLKNLVFGELLEFDKAKNDIVANFK